MFIVFDSLTGKNKLFVDKLKNKEIKKIPIKQAKNIDEPVLLITRSFNYGEVPLSTKRFLEKYADKVIGVAVSGNKNWGKHLFGGAGDRINFDYGIPLVHKYELSGTDVDVKIIDDFIEEFLKKGE